MFLDLEPGEIHEPVAGRRWNRSEIRKEVGQRVARLHARGVRPDDRVLLPFGNRLEFFAELLATWRVGACAVPIDSRLTAFEVETLARAAAPRLAIVDESTSSEILKALANAGVAVQATAETANEVRTSSAVRLDADALMLFTSGSTGDPKGVMHTHRSLRARWMALHDHLGVKAFERTLCMLPTHFGHGLICNALFPWLSGNDLFVTPPFRPELISRLGALIDEHAITFMSSVPPIWKVALKMAKRPQRETLRRVHCGSAPLSAHAWGEIRAWTGTQNVCNAYGITETGSWVAGLIDASAPAEDGLIGTGWGALIRILRTDDTSSPPAISDACAAGEQGYVWLNTPALMKGYFNRDDLTAKAVAEGWFMTGDIGFLDEGGRLLLRGRERDEINRGGMKIYPSDIDAVADRFDRVADACAFALEDPVYGQAVGLAVVLSAAGGDVTRDQAIRDLHAWLRAHIAEHKMPSRWWAVDAIPRTSRGKINRDAVRAACEAVPALDIPSILKSRAGA